MSILGVILRAREADLPAIGERLATLPGVDQAARDGGRLVLVIEDAGGRSAAATMAEIALWPQVLNTSLVYEYSGPDVPGDPGAVQDYADWRTSLAEMAGHAKKPT
jgi:periplasmic nitrate reductase NapD